MENRKPNPIETAIKQAFLVGVLLGAALMYAVLFFCGWEPRVSRGQTYPTVVPADHILLQYDMDAPHLWLA